MKHASTSRRPKQNRVSLRAHLDGERRDNSGHVRRKLPQPKVARHIDRACVERQQPGKLPVRSLGSLASGHAA